PCRVCLEEAKVGEEVLLFSYSPFERPVPYRSVGPVFVHARSCAPYGPHASVPELMRSRLISLRAYDSRDRMVECDVVDGSARERHRLIRNGNAVEEREHLVPVSKEFRLTGRVDRRSARKLYLQGIPMPSVLKEFVVKMRARGQTG